MEMTRFKRLIRMTLLAVLTSMAVVGCGDGDTKHRQKMRPNPDFKTGDKSQAPGATTTLTPEQEAKKAAELKAATAEQNRLDGLLANQIAGDQLIEKTSLALGSYTLSGLITSYQIKDPDTWMSAFSQGTIQIVNRDVGLVNESVDAGGISSDKTDAGRALEIPVSFVVAKKDGQNYFNPTRSDFKDFLILNTQVISSLVGGSAKISVKNTLQAGAAETNPVSLAGLMMGNTVGKDTNQPKYTAMTSSNQQVDLYLRKMADGNLHAYFEIKEAEGVIRYVVLTYTFKATETEATAPAQAQTEEETQTQGNP